MANLTFTRCPGVGNLTLASRKCQNPLGMPPTLGLNIDRCIRFLFPFERRELFEIYNIAKGDIAKKVSKEVR